MIGNAYYFLDDQGCTGCYYLNIKIDYNSSIILLPDTSIFQKSNFVLKLRHVNLLLVIASYRVGYKS